MKNTETGKFEIVLVSLGCPNKIPWCVWLILYKINLFLTVLETGKFEVLVGSFFLACM